MDRRVVAADLREAQNIRLADGAGVFGGSPTAICGLDRHLSLQCPRLQCSSLRCGRISRARPPGLRASSCRRSCGSPRTPWRPSASSGVTSGLAMTIDDELRGRIERADLGRQAVARRHADRRRVDDDVVAGSDRLRHDAEPRRPDSCLAHARQRDSRPWRHRAVVEGDRRSRRLPRRR